MEQGLRAAARPRADGWIIGLGVATVLLLPVRLWLDSRLDLMFDEAYYVLWSQHLAWCYLDHPPMVALWIRASTWLFGDDAFGVRALGTLAAAAGGPLVYLLSWRLFESRAEAAFAGLLYCAMLLTAAGAIIITPDTPLLFFWSIAVYAVIRTYRDEDWSARRWALPCNRSIRRCCSGRASSPRWLSFRQCDPGGVIRRRSPPVRWPS